MAEIITRLELDAFGVEVGSQVYNQALAKAELTVLKFIEQNRKAQAALDGTATRMVGSAHRLDRHLGVAGADVYSAFCSRCGSDPLP